MRNAFIDGLMEAANVDPSVALFTGDLGFSVVEKFQNRFPKQFINTGVNEQSMIGIASGFSAEGNHSFVYSIGNFPTLRCLEQIRNDVCAMNSAVCIVSVGAGYAYGSQGYSHHAIEDLSIMRAIPNLEVYSPCDPEETVQLMKIIISKRKPTYLRLGKNGDAPIHNNKLELTPGKMIEIVNGEDGTIIFTGSIGQVALKAANYLKSLGIHVSVTSAPFISDIDAAYLHRRSLAGAIVTLEENTIKGGLGSAILEKMSECDIVGVVKLIGISAPNIRLIGSQNYLRESHGLTVEEISRHFMRD